MGQDQVIQLIWILILIGNIWPCQINRMVKVKLIRVCTFALRVTYS